MLQTLKTFVHRIWLIESNKLKKMGLRNVIIAYFIFYLYFFKLTEYVKSNWPKEVEDKLTFQVILGFSIFFLSTPVYLLIYLPGYLGASFYKKYEIEPDRKWPWELPNWKEMRKKTINNILINSLIVFPTYVLIGVKLSGTPLNFEGFPTPF